MERDCIEIFIFLLILLMSVSMIFRSSNLNLTSNDQFCIACAVIHFPSYDILKISLPAISYLSSTLVG